MGIIIFLMPLGNHLFCFVFCFFHSCLFSHHFNPNQKGSFSTFYITTKLLPWVLKMFQKWGQSERDNKICRPNGRSITAATVLMDFPFSIQQYINRKPIIHYTAMLTKYYWVLCCQSYVYIPSVIKRYVIFVSLSFAENKRFLIPDNCALSNPSQETLQ